MADRVGAVELAEQLGVTRQYVHKLAKAGVIPYELNEKGWFTYDLDEARREYARFNAVKKGATSLDNDDQEFDSASDDDVVDLKVERARQEVRIKRATADMKERERDEMLGKYHRAEFVEDWVTELLLAHRSAMSALPGKLAPLLVGETDAAVIAAIIKSEVRAIQEDMSRFEYNPGYYQERLAEEQGKAFEDDDKG
ncbi:MAG: hypothetical protein IJ087_01625 [Eggerthellaceae bacterium]|nr:hypothetical protein [Eggerthellaceae bacterium]